MTQVSAIEPARVAEKLGRDLLEAARYCADDDRAIVGYAIVALYDNGCSAVCTKMDLPDEMLMNRYAFVGMCTELIREALITSEAARQMVNRANGYD